MTNEVHKDPSPNCFAQFNTKIIAECQRDKNDASLSESVNINFCDRCIELRVVNGGLIEGLFNR